MDAAAEKRGTCTKKRPEASLDSALPGLPARSATAGFGSSSSSVCSPQETRDQLEQKFDKEFSKHIHKKNKLAKYGLGALGAGIGGAVGVAASPLLIPGLAVAALVGGAGGYQFAKRLGKQELQRHGAGGAHQANPEAAAAECRPTLRRLRYLAKWGHFQLIEFEEAAPELRCAVLDEVAGSFSPWVQKIYLLRAKGMLVETDPEVFEVLQHLAPLYNLLQRRATVDAMVESTKMANAAFDESAADNICVERCHVVFPTILETISTLDRLSSATREMLPKDAEQEIVAEEEFSAQRRHRQHRLQKIVDAIRQVLERTDVQEILADPHHHSQQAATHAAMAEPASPATVRAFELPPEGVENEAGAKSDEDGDDDGYFSVSSGDEAAPQLRRCKSGGSSRCAKEASPSSRRARAASDATASCERRAASFCRGTGNHTWQAWDASLCRVRSQSYLKDKKKEPSGPAMLELLNCDIFQIGEDGPVMNPASHPGFFPAYHRRTTGDTRFLFVQNWVFPPYQSVMTAALNLDAAWLQDLDSPQAKVWKAFLDADNEMRRRTFKVFIVVEQGPWLVRRALPAIPVLIGTKVKMESFHKPGDYLELVFDTSSGGNMERLGVSTCCKALPRLQLVFNCLIEGQTEDQLPENVLFSASMLNLDPAKLFVPNMCD